MCDCQLLTNKNLQRPTVLKIRDLDLSSKHQKHNYAGGSKITEVLSCEKVELGLRFGRVCIPGKAENVSWEKKTSVAQLPKAQIPPCSRACGIFKQAL